MTVTLAPFMIWVELNRAEWYRITLLDEGSTSIELEQTLLGTRPNHMPCGDGVHVSTLVAALAGSARFDHIVVVIVSADRDVDLV